MMNIIVCIKQVPDTAEIKIDPVTNTLIRAGVPSIVNPYDKNALEEALRLKELHGGNVTVVSMGPPAAKDALKECIAMGADDAILLTDRAFGGSDTYATSYILSYAISHLVPYDIILCGKQAIDGDTGQTGASMSEHLGIPQLTYAVKIEADMERRVVRVHREGDEGVMVLEAGLPVLCTVGKDINEPRTATMKGKMRANKTEIREVTAQELPNMEEDKRGLKGSPTRVKKTFTPSVKKSGLIVSGDNPEEAIGLLIQDIQKKELWK